MIKQKSKTVKGMDDFKKILKAIEEHVKKRATKDWKRMKFVFCFHVKRSGKKLITVSSGYKFEEDMYGG